MRFVSLLLLSLLLASSAAASPAADLRRHLALEPDSAGSSASSRWFGGPSATVALDSTTTHGGRYAGRLERDASSASQFSSYAIEIPVDFSGRRLQLRGWLKYENVAGYCGLWQRQDGSSTALQFDNMASRQLKGTADWKEYTIDLPLDGKARKVTVGALLVGTGRVWVDDLSLLVDGKPSDEAPRVVVAPTVNETDTSFAAGSLIALERLTRVQIENLQVLGKVWGFLKYHHPVVVAGRRQWDFELFRTLPAVLAARDRAAAQRVMASWVRSLGEVPPCTSCAEPPTNPKAAPRLGWLQDTARLGKDLSAQLVAIHARRPKVAEQFYVKLAGGVGNPDFSNELWYSRQDDPDAGYRLLALFRWWNVIEYWFPSRDLIGEDWDATLREFIPRMANARGREAYQLELLALIDRIHDTHASLGGGLGVQPPRGLAYVPVAVRFVEGQAVVSMFLNPRLGPATGLRPGDAIRAIDGTPVDTLVARWRAAYPASNESARLRDMALNLLRGAEGPVRLQVVRDGAQTELVCLRAPADSSDRRAQYVHDQPGPAVRRLSPDIAYLKMSSVSMDDVPKYLEAMAGARCVVIDIRNYPAAFLVFALGQHLVRENTPFVRFTMGDPANPGAFVMREPLGLAPVSPWVEGQIVILVDEVTQSSAEYTTMAFRARPGALVVGSQTAGADGNVSTVPLPGGYRSRISGLGVYYPDGRETQRIGIVPDLVVRPTIAGIRAGRDEVLEAAVRKALGREIDAAELAALHGGRP